VFGGDAAIDEGDAIFVVEFEVLFAFAETEGSVGG